MARFGGLVATDLLDVTSDPAALDSTGFWAVAADFEGALICARFGDVRPASRCPPRARRAGAAPPPATGPSSLDRAAYTGGVRRIREHIAAGEVYQANLCRVLSAPLPDPGRADVDALTALLARGNPAPYAGTIRLPGHGVEIATASPELYLRRDGRIVASGPIKGTGRTEADLLGEGPRRERDDRGPGPQRSRPGLRHRHRHRPGTVRRRGAPRPGPPRVHGARRTAGRREAGWAELLGATFPPGSVTGAPKSSALRIIDELETAPRGPYCGGIGWVDADRGTGELAVGIRTFWIDRTRRRPVLRFGTGAGITWGSDPEREWAETELKARRLLAVASGTVRGEWRIAMKIWLNGGLEDAEGARVSVFDHGLTVGDGIFETIKAIDGPPLRPHPPPGPADPLRPRPGPARSRPRRGAPRLRGRPRRQPDAARPAADHLHRRPWHRSAPTAATPARRSSSRSARPPRRPDTTAVSPSPGPATNAARSPA